MKASGNTLLRIFFAVTALSSVLLLSAFQGVTTGSAQATTRKIYLPILMNGLPLSLLNGDFELGRVNWMETSLKNQVIIINVTSSPYSGLRIPAAHSGKWIGWLGGDYNENSAISQKVTIIRGYPYLTYWHYIDSDGTTCSSSKDIARILVNSAVYTTYELCKANNTGKWVQKFVDLTSFAGKDVTVSISVITDGTENSNLFVDDVSFTSGPTSTASHLDEEIPGLDPALPSAMKDQVP